MNRKTLTELMPQLQGVRLFKKERGDPRWREIEREFLWAISDMRPVFARGKKLEFSWMVPLPTAGIEAWHKWELYDQIHDVCENAGMVTLFVSGSAMDKHALTHVVAPGETEAIILDAVIINATEDYKKSR